MLGDLDGESLGEAAGGMDGTPRRVDRRKGSDDSRRDWEAWMEGLGGESLGEAVGGLNGTWDPRTLMCRLPCRYVE
jgi:hypothetical protein